MTKRKTHYVIDTFLSLIALLFLLWTLISSKTILGEFNETIILSQAYVGIFKGLQVTVQLTVVGTILGTLFGSVFCLIRMSNIRSLASLGKILIEVLRGTPVVMLLMFLYFLVFVGSFFDALFVAMVGYGLNTGAHMAEIFRTSINAVNPKEIEAGRMLGLSRSKAFLHITFPQSWKIAKPIYESSIITLLQWTTVAGYISVTELTRLL